MKRSMFVSLIGLIVLSLLLIAAGCPPGAREEGGVQFFATESCVVVKEGERVEKDGWAYYRDRELECQMVSMDSQMNGRLELRILDPRYKAYGKEHTVVGKFHLYVADNEWVGFRWGTIDKGGTITWMNGWAGTPESGYFWRCVAWFRYEGADVTGWSKHKGD